MFLSWLYRFKQLLLLNRLAVLAAAVFAAAVLVATVTTKAVPSATALMVTAPVAAAPRPRLFIDGSSTVFPISEAMAEEYQTLKRGKVLVTVGISGTGGGMKKFCRGQIDIANASRTISHEEQEKCHKQNIRFFEIPVAYDALTVLVHQSNTFVKELSIEELQLMWASTSQNKIRKWSQIRASWPDQEFHLYGPGPDSGTFDYFTEIINGKAKSSRGDYAASEDDNILVQGMLRDPLALGYLGFAYYKPFKNKLKAVAIINPLTQKAVLPSETTVRDSSYFPLSRPLFIYVNVQSFTEKPFVREFVSYYLDSAEHIVADTGYIPLSKKAYALAKKIIALRREGSYGQQAHRRSLEAVLSEFLNAQ